LIRGLGCHAIATRTRPGAVRAMRGAAIAPMLDRRLVAGLQPVDRRPPTARQAHA